jgi:HAD superfamily hydrolase (TIGR01549 family)
MSTVSPTLAAQHQLVIFDLDGTLYNKRRLSLRMLLHAPFDMLKMLAERKTRASMKGLYIGTEHFTPAYFDRLARGMHTSPAKAKQWYQERYMPLMVKLIGQYQPIGEWVMPFVLECKERGVKMVVLSDYDFAQEKLQALGIDPQLCDWVVSAPELGGLKPAAELLQLVAQQMGVAAEHCLVIGDRQDTDGDMARATGAAFFPIQY